MVKKIAKKVTKKIAKKKIVKKSVKKSKTAKAVKIPVVKPLGVVTHFYAHIGVAIVKFAKPVKVGDNVSFKGATTNFSQVVGSMQYDHKDIVSAKPKQEVGIKVKKRVREGDEIFSL